MSRDWLAIYGAMLGKPKYRRLSIPGRAALFHVWLLAGRQDPEATWTNRDELADVLDLDGFPPDVLEELVARRWLDVDPAGRVLVHDWDEHQLAATKAIGRAYEADRLRAWRRRKSGDGDGFLSPDPSLSVQDKTGTQHHKTEQEHVQVRTRTYVERENDLHAPVAEPRRPSGKRPNGSPAGDDCIVCHGRADVTDTASVYQTPRGLVHTACRDAYHAGAV